MLASTLVSEASLGRNAAHLLRSVSSAPRPVRSHRIASESFDGAGAPPAQAAVVSSSSVAVATPAAAGAQPRRWATVPLVAKPVWRGLLHRYAAFVALFAGAFLVSAAPNDNAKLAASLYTGGMVAMVRGRSWTAAARGRGA